MDAGSRELDDRPLFLLVVTPPSKSPCRSSTIRTRSDQFHHLYPGEINFLIPYFLMAMNS